jgi:hypothetical protein
MAGVMFPLAIAGAAAFALLSKGGRWSPGDGPFDLLPEGIGSKPLETNTVHAASGRKYTLTSYQRGATQKFHVAVSGGDWISFIVDEKTSSRVLYRAHGADQKALDALRGDFAL